MKKIIVLIIMFTLCINSICYSSDLNIQAQSSILIDSDSGRILYSNNCYNELPMASTTKIMTALIALENGKLDDIVEIKKEGVGIEGSSIYLFEGENICLKDLIYGLMLRSGNDAATAIAYHIGGNIENFVQMMNKKAKEIGALNTNFINPHGLEDENHYTTAYDLALITREALNNKEFKEIVKTKLWISNRTKNKYFYNKNKTLWQYDGGDGVKIGYTKKAGRCLVSSATRNNMQLISVVLNDGNWFNDCYKLFDYGFSNYVPCLIYDKYESIRKIKVVGGKKEFLSVYTTDDFVFPLKNKEKDKVKIVLDLPRQMKAPIKKGQEIGKISVYLDGKLINSNILVAKENILKMSLLDKLKKSLAK